MTDHLLPHQDRIAKGKTLRLSTPREAHGEPIRVNAGLHGGRDVIPILSARDQFRVPELLPLRYDRMVEDPFAFLRGAASVMAHDLVRHPAAQILVQACGDCHLMNFGALATAEDNILFDITDFDETLPGVDFTVDVKRLVTSVAVAAQAADLGDKKAKQLAARTVEAYRTHIADLSELSPQEVWHSRIDLESFIEEISNKGLRKRLERIVSRARGIGLENDDNFPHLVAGDPPLIADKAPSIFHIDPLADSAHQFDAHAVFAAYKQTLHVDRAHLLRQFERKDVAFKAVGVGSVGTFCVVALYMSADQDPLFLQVKEASPSVLEPLSAEVPVFAEQGQRVVNGQRMMQAASDSFLGFATDPTSGRQFYVRTLKNRRLGAIGELTEAHALADYAVLCGRTLARAHARSADAATLTGYLGKSDAFDEAIATFAMRYAEQTRQDHATLVAWHRKNKGGDH